MVNLGSVGAGIYGFFNRLLIPVGLHHALNSVFWFDVAGINDIPNFLGGAKSLAEGKAVLGITGRYQAGFFPIMMFGLPGAGLAIYRAAKPANRTRVASLMLAAGFASFFTGVTEPLEFAFMFVAPVLYGLHAVLTGISVFIAAQFHWIAGFGFSAGLVDMALSARNPLAVNWYMLILQGLVFFALYYFTFSFVIRKFNLKTPGREDEEVSSSLAAPTVPVPDAHSASPAKALSLGESYLAIIGGATNILNVDACITRLRLTLKDGSIVNEVAAKQLGASGVIHLNQQNVQIVIGPKAELIAEEIKQLIGGNPQ